MLDVGCSETLQILIHSHCHVHVHEQCKMTQAYMGTSNSDTPIESVSSGL